MPRFWLSALILLCLTGCESVSRKGPVESPQTLADQTAIVPVNDFERNLLRAPVDPEALASHAIWLSSKANAEMGADTARILRKRAWKFGTLATQNGSKNLLIPVLLAELTEAGDLLEKRLGASPQVDLLMQSGEAKFRRGNLDGALVDYKAAYALDPQCYHAALYVGDVFFGRKEYAQALPWFDCAIAINPMIESAHRYKGDALNRLRRIKEAGAAYVDAFVAAPFASLPTAALEHWAARQGTSLQRPDTHFLNGTLHFKNGQAVIDYNTAQPGNSLRMAYLLTRAKYATEHFSNRENYRQTLAEEASALRSTIKVAEELKSKKPNSKELVQLSSTLDFLKQMDDQGLLEAAILLDRPTKDLAQDYAPYRAKHADLLVRYIKTVWLGNTL